jgi:hypothetical protein
LELSAGSSSPSQRQQLIQPYGRMFNTSPSTSFF